MRIDKNKSWKKPARVAAFAVSAVAVCGSAQAFIFQTGEWEWRVDSEATAGVAVRVEEQSSELIGLPNGGNAFSVNGDDGNLNFEKGDVTSAAVKLTTDWTVGNDAVTFSARTRFLYDTIYDDDSPLQPNRPALSEEAQDKVGRSAEAIEAYFSTDFSIGETDATLKVGKRVLGWGEATFIPGGINFDAVDVANLRTPGANIRDAYIGSKTASLFFDVGDNTLIETFYQLHTQITEPDPSGTYFSTNDFATPGAEFVMLRFGQVAENDPDFTIARGEDQRSRDNGQIGVSVRTWLEAFNGIDLGLYAANYHSRLPVLSGVSKNGPPSTGSYFVEYPEDINLIGVSFNTTAAGWAIYGDYAFRNGQPLQVDDVELLYAALGAADQLDADPNTAGTQNFAPGSYIQGWRRHNTSQITFGTLKTFGADSLLFADDMVLVVEAGVNKVHDLPDESVLRYEGPLTYLKGGTDTLGASPGQQNGGFATDFSWGYRVIARLSYLSVADNINVYPRLVFFHDVEGTTPGPGGAFVEGRMSGSAAVTVSIGNNFDIEASYAAYFGSSDFNNVEDRDFASASVAYRF